VALAHKMVRTIYAMLSTPEFDTKRCK
jgi:hypothetical protein